MKMEIRKTADDSISKMLQNIEFSMEDYLKQIFDERLLIKVPDAEDRTLTTSTKLLEKDKQLRRIHEDLLQRKDEFQVKMQYFEQRRQELEKKECQLKESLIRFEKFFKENDEKKARALKKLSQERSLQKQRVKEIENLTAEMRILEQKRDKLERVVKSYAKYRDFLVAVLKESEDFSEIPELIHRYDALTANLEDLKARERLNNQQYEQLDGDLRRYREVTYDEKLTLTNELVGMRNKLERYQTKIRQKEQTWEHAREAAVNRISELCTIKAATQNMYKIARTYEKYGEEAHADDVTSQLRIISDFIVDLVEVTKTLSPRMKEK